MAQTSVERPPPDNPDRAAAEAPIPRPRFRQWWMVSLLSAGIVCSITDRTGITLLVGPIKAQFGFSDLQMSLLLGIAFLAPYSLCAIPAGYLADLVNRRFLLSSAVVIWSCMSSFCGFAGSFTQLFIGRSGVGMAEATLTPTANSLIRDSFPPENRGRAFAIYTMGSMVGAGVGVFFIGALISSANADFFHNWPVLGHMKTWQIVLAVPGMCTMSLAFLILTVREPVRRSSAILGSAVPSWAVTMGYFRDHWWVYLPLFTGSMVNGWAREGYTNWEPTALIRGWGLPAAQIAHITGELSLTLGVCGLLGIGYVMERWIERGRQDAPLLIMCIGQLGVMACNLTILHMPQGHAELIYWLIGVRVLFMGPRTVGMAITISLITPSRLMGRITAVLFLCGSLLATTGPTGVALISRFGFSGDLAIIPAMQVFFVPVQIVATTLHFVAATQVRRFFRLHADGAA